MEEKTRHVWGKKVRKRRPQRSHLPKSAFPLGERRAGEKQGVGSALQNIYHTITISLIRKYIYLCMHRLRRPAKEREKAKATGSYAISSHLSHRCSLLLLMNDGSHFHAHMSLRRVPSPVHDVALLRTLITV